MLIPAQVDGLVWIIVMPWWCFLPIIFMNLRATSIYYKEAKEEPVEAINQNMAQTPFYIPFDRPFKE